MTSTNADAVHAAETDRAKSNTLLAVSSLIALAAPWLVLLLAPIAQPQAYHAFADQRMWSGVPHAMNVLSNLPFALVGVLGLVCVARRRAVQGSEWPYALFFAGALLTAFGSAWYHAAPSDATLVWDRLPIAAAFAGLVAGTVADRQPRWSVPMTLGFGAVAAATVLWWAATGNLLPYVVMQVCFFAVVLVVTAFVPSRWSHAHAVFVGAAIYALAIACERLDVAVAAALDGALSGHTLKHLFAAAALAVILAMLARRRPLAEPH
jgi:hypothetical protein